MDCEAAGLWPTGADWDGGMEAADAIHTGDRDAEFSWPLAGVNFHEFWFLTGAIHPSERPQLTVWRYLQGQRSPDRVGTLSQYLDGLRRPAAAR